MEFWIEEEIDSISNINNFRTKSPPLGDLGVKMKNYERFI